MSYFPELHTSSILQIDALPAATATTTATATTLTPPEVTTSSTAALWDQHHRNPNHHRFESPLRVATEGQEGGDTMKGLTETTVSWEPHHQKHLPSPLGGVAGTQEMETALWEHRHKHLSSPLGGVAKEHHHKKHLPSPLGGVAGKQEMETALWEHRHKHLPSPLGGVKGRQEVDTAMWEHRHKNLPSPLGGVAGRQEKDNALWEHRYKHLPSPLGGVAGKQETETALREHCHKHLPSPLGGVTGRHDMEEALWEYRHKHLPSPLGGVAERHEVGTAMREHRHKHLPTPLGGVANERHHKHLPSPLGDLAGRKEVDPALWEHRHKRLPSPQGGGVAGRQEMDSALWESHLGRGLGRHAMDTALWDQQQGQQHQVAVAGGQDTDTMEEEVRTRYQRLSEVGVPPTEAPCSSPVHSYASLRLPSLRSRHPGPTSHRLNNNNNNKNGSTATTTILRDLDSRVRFYVTADNASERVTSGRAFMRSATPVWNRALLRGGAGGGGGRHHNSGSNDYKDNTNNVVHARGDSSSGGCRQEHKSNNSCYDRANFSRSDSKEDEGGHDVYGGGGGDGREGKNKKQKLCLNLDVTKIPSPFTAAQRNAAAAAIDDDEYQNEMSPFAVDLIQDHVPGLEDPKALEKQHDHDHDHAHHQAARLDQLHVDQQTARATGRTRNYGSASRRLKLQGAPEHPPPHLPLTHHHHHHHHHHDSEHVQGPEYGQGGGGGVKGEGHGRGGEELHQPAHPFLRMYQTRPGAFARLLSREPDQKITRVAPGSTIASLMIAHPATVGGGGREGDGVWEDEEEEFEECVQGTTIEMKNKKKRKKLRARFTLPTLAHIAMEWPKRRYHHHLRRGEKNDTTNTNNNDKDDQARTTKVPKAALHTLCDFPKQFVLSSREDDALMDLDMDLNPNHHHHHHHQYPYSDSEVSSDWTTTTTAAATAMEGSLEAEDARRLDREMVTFSDLDYVSPGHLQELLRQEGVDERVVSSTVALEKLWTDRAAYLSHIYHIKRRKYLARPSRYSSLPPIGGGSAGSASRGGRKGGSSPLLLLSQPTTPSGSDVEARRERRENRPRPWEIPLEPEPAVTGGEESSRAEPRAEGGLNKNRQLSLEDKARAELEQFRTEMEIIRWEAERFDEVTSLPPEFVHPRLVLISSKVPRCQSMSKAIRRGDSSIIYIVYDFDTCSFSTLLDMCRQRLDEYCPGCKAKSALFMCQGAEGCLYMFRKIVLTPQKMKRVQYQQIKEFWRSLGELMSKADREETAVHLMGGNMENTQGKTLQYEIQKAILPNLVRVTWLDDASERGKEAVRLYFDFRKFLLWRSKHDSSCSLDYTDITRSWSSLADEGEEMDTRQ